VSSAIYPPIVAHRGRRLSRSAGVAQLLLDALHPVFVKTPPPGDRERVQPGGAVQFPHGIRKARQRLQVPLNSGGVPTEDRPGERARRAHVENVAARRLDDRGERRERRSLLDAGGLHDGGRGVDQADQVVARHDGGGMVERPRRGRDLQHRAAQ